MQLIADWSGPIVFQGNNKNRAIARFMSLLYYLPAQLTSIFTQSLFPYPWTLDIKFLRTNICFHRGSP